MTAFGKWVQMTGGDCRLTWDALMARSSASEVEAVDAALEALGTPALAAAALDDVLGEPLASLPRTFAEMLEGISW